MRSSILAWLLALGLFAAAPVLAAPVDCRVGPAIAAAANTAQIRTLPLKTAGRDEVGWYVYAPRIAETIRSACPFGSPGFAAAITGWQIGRKLPPTGQIDAATLSALFGEWHARRPYVALRAAGICPAAPELETLAPISGYADKPILLRPAALAAYRNMRAAARAALPAVAADSRWLAIFSGFRAPDADAARCAVEQNCDGVTRAECSVHRTGLAIDVYVGTAPGMSPDSSNDTNRIAMSQTPAYRWLVQNAQRFGFVNYAFEPWHWEWTGEAPLPPAPVIAVPRAPAASVSAPPLPHSLSAPPTRR